MTTSSCATIMFRGYRARGTVLLGLVLFTVLLDTVSGTPYKRSLLRLCSKSLSDALYLACKGRGYNEPFSYSGEDDQDSLGPGLADECCYRQCTYSQLEQYCKPEKPNSADAVKKQVWIVNTIPYPSVRPGTSSEERSRSDIDYVAGTIKCRIHGLKGARKKGTNLDRDNAICDRKNTLKRHRSGYCVCKHRRQRRRRLGKVLENVLADRSSKNEALNEEVSAGKGSSFP